MSAWVRSGKVRPTSAVAKIFFKVRPWAPLRSNLGAPKNFSHPPLFPPRQNAADEFLRDPFWCMLCIITHRRLLWWWKRRRLWIGARCRGRRLGHGVAIFGAHDFERRASVCGSGILALHLRNSAFERVAHVFGRLLRGRRNWSDGRDWSHRLWRTIVYGGLWARRCESSSWRM